MRGSASPAFLFPFMDIVIKVKLAECTNNITTTVGPEVWTGREVGAGSSTQIVLRLRGSALCMETFSLYSCASTHLGRHISISIAPTLALLSLLYPVLVCLYVARRASLVLSSVFGQMGQAHQLALGARGVYRYMRMSRD